MANQQILQQIANADVKLIVEKDATYKGSWKKRGGVGAYFTLIRPIDRFTALAENPPAPKVNPFDIFAQLEADDAAGISGKDGTLLACIRDIRCYLMLVEMEIQERKQANNYFPNNYFQEVTDIEDRPTPPIKRGGPDYITPGQTDKT